ncbi:MAG: phage portal protein [Betaproteobacteria bacterium]|nr:phage portal protein [Betaproteobacteria bacterium]
MQPTKTPIEPGMIARAVGGLRAAMNVWFGPQEPLPPMAPKAQQASIAGRQFDYPIGFNLWTKPRQQEAISFEQMRGLADACDVLRLVIETRKDQVEKMQWQIVPRDDAKQPDDRCKRITDFLLTPDREHDWNTWLRMVLEDLLVIDAPAVYPCFTRGGELYSLEPVDGSTVKRVLDVSGRTPLPPDPAYQQILKGVPAINYTREELIYRPRNVRTHKVYGFSPVEQIIATVNLALRRQMHVLEYYTAGTVPDALVSVPKEWSAQQIADFQKYWDLMLEGDSAQKRKLKFVPDGMGVTLTKEALLKDEFDEWLARIVCFAFSISPTPFIKQQNRATADNATAQAREEGLAPVQNWIAALINTVISAPHLFNAPDLRFAWKEEDSEDPLTQAQVNQIYVTCKVLHPDEVRADLGREPLTSEQKAELNPPPPPGFGGEDEEGKLSGKPDAKPQDKEQSKVGAKEALAKVRKKALRPINPDRPFVAKARKALAKATEKFLQTQALKIAEQISGIAGLEKASRPSQSWRARAKEILAQLDLSKWTDEIQDLYEDMLAAVAADGGGAALRQIDAAEEAEALIGERAVEYAEARAAEMVGMKWVDGERVPNPDARWQITDATRDMIQDAVAQALDEGWSNDKLASALQEHYAFSDARAETIARTETAFADTAGAMEGWRASGLVSKKEWLAAPDCCDACQELDGDIVGLDELFEGGVAAAPLHPGCRCDVLPVLDDEKDAVAKADWNEDDHPRDEAGRFAGGASVELSGSELGEHASTKDMRRAAMGYAEENLIGKSFKNENSGHSIKVTRQGVKHALSRANFPELKILPGLGQLLAHAEYKGSEPAKANKPHIVAAHKYSATVKVGDEKLSVGIVTLEKAGGHEHYDHFIAELCSSRTRQL